MAAETAGALEDRPVEPPPANPPELLDEPNPPEVLDDPNTPEPNASPLDDASRNPREVFEPNPPEVSDDPKLNPEVLLDDSKLNPEVLLDDSKPNPPELFEPNPSGLIPKSDKVKTLLLDNPNPPALFDAPNELLDPDPEVREVVGGEADGRSCNTMIAFAPAWMS